MKLTHNPDIVNVVTDYQLTEYLKHEISYVAEDVVDYIVDENTTEGLNVLYPLHTALVNQIKQQNKLNMRTPIISPDNNVKYNPNPTGLVPEMERVNSQGNSQNNSAQPKPMHVRLNSD